LEPSWLSNIPADTFNRYKNGLLKYPERDLPAKSRYGVTSKAKPFGRVLVEVRRFEMTIPTSRAVDGLSIASGIVSNTLKAGASGMAKSARAFSASSRRFSFVD